MTLDQLRIFVAVAARSHMRRAAEDLHMTQSAVSAAVAVLEGQHQVRLFDRVGRRIELTDEGRAFLPTARAVLSQADTARIHLGDLAREPRGRLRIHASQTVASHWLPRRLVTLHARHPGIAIALTVGNTAQVAEAVSTGAADIGFVEGDVTQGDLMRKVVAEDELALVTATGNPFAALPQPSADDYRAALWVLREPGSGSRAQFETHLGGMGLTLGDLTVAFHLPSNEAVLAAIAAGPMVGMISHRAARGVSGLTVRQVSWAPAPRRSFSALTHPERHRTRAVQALFDVLSPGGQADGLAKEAENPANGPQSRTVVQDKTDMIGQPQMISTDTGRWTDRPAHRAWLQGQADALWDFFQPAFVDPQGGFLDLRADGTPLDPAGQVHPIHIAARAVHCFAIGALLGRPGSAAVVDHGMDYLWTHHRDRAHGGYHWSVRGGAPVDATKQGYGHAFVLLAASSAKLVGHPLADAMLADVTDILETRFWGAAHGAIAEEFTADWQPLEGGTYRGQNSNMHLTEALMAAFEATGDSTYLARARSIADLVINRAARSAGWRVAEHFDAGWTIDRSYYHPNEMFRPAGTTPGHWLEWARLLLQLWVLDGRREGWMVEAAEALFRQSMALGWDGVRGGFFYTLDWDDRPAKSMKLWWPACEGAAAAHVLNDLSPSPEWEGAYRRIWDVIAAHHIDRTHGGWHEELTEDLRPSHALFPGKGDIYHALQACLIPLYPAVGSLTRAIGMAR